MLIYLVELKSRVCFFMLTLFLLVGIFFFFSEEVLYFFVSETSSAFESSFIATTVTEIFWIRCQLAIFFACFLSLPLMSWHLFFFLRPGLYKYESQFFFEVLGVFFVCLLFLVWMNSIFLLPSSLSFFTGLESVGKEKLIQIFYEVRIQDFFSFVFSLFYIFVGMSFFVTSGYVVGVLVKVTPVIIAKSRKLFYLIFFTLSALLSPPDGITQFILAFLFCFFLEGFFFWFIVGSCMDH